jgi:peroxiredoxin Q/BCP
MAANSSMTGDSIIMTAKEIEIGKSVPAFTMPAAGGEQITSAQLKGAPYVLYFYPKADTSGCTVEAEAFQANLKAFTKLGANVIGVSRDPVAKLEKFAAKYGLSFPLASDDAGKVTEAFGVWVEKSMYGRKYMGIERATFLVGADGKVAALWRKVKIPGHAEEVLAALKTIKP